MKFKVNFQKIIAVVVSTAVITFSFVSVSVFADSESSMTNKEYYASQAYLVAKYKDGKISYSEFQQQTQAITDEFVSKNTVGGVLQAGALNASNTFNAVAQKIGSTVQKYGESARDYINDYVSDFFNSYTVLSDKPTTDLKGYGAVVESTLIKIPTYANGSDDATYRQLESCDYVVILGNGSYRLCSSNGTYLNEFYTYFDGHLHMSTSYKATVKIRSEHRTYKFYGDIRYEDGTQAPTDDTYETISDYDFSHASDKELEDLLKKILNEMELEQPDLSSIEGILKALYAKLGTLDSDDDVPTLSLINSAINTLVAENKESNETIIEKLENLKLETDNQAVLDKLNEIYPQYDYDTDISRTEELKILFLTKWAFVEELKTLIDRFMSSYEQKSSLGTMDNVIHVKYHPSNGSFGNVILNYNGAYDIRFDIFEPYLPTVRGLIAAFIYLSYAFNTYRKIPSYIRGGDTE